MAIDQAIRFSNLHGSHSLGPTLLNDDRFGHGAVTRRAPGGQTFEIGKLNFTASL